MERREPSDSATQYPAIPEEYYMLGSRYADRRGRIGSNFSQRMGVLYPETSRLKGGLLTSLLTTPELDSNYVQRFQSIAIIAQLADSILAVAQATGKSVVPLADFDGTNSNPEDCACESCIKQEAIVEEGGPTETINSREGKEEPAAGQKSEEPNESELEAASFITQTISTLAVDEAKVTSSVAYTNHSDSIQSEDDSNVSITTTIISPDVGTSNYDVVAAEANSTSGSGMKKHTRNDEKLQEKKTENKIYEISESLCGKEDQQRVSSDASSNLWPR